jgi:hypothetical protein
MTEEYHRKPSGKPPDSVLAEFGLAFPCVSTAFPRLETGSAAYLSGIWPSVSAFPSFRLRAGA